MTKLKQDKLKVQKEYLEQKARARAAIKAAIGTNNGTHDIYYKITLAEVPKSSAKNGEGLNMLVEE